MVLLNALALVHAAILRGCKLVQWTKVKYTLMTTRSCYTFPSLACYPPLNSLSFFLLFWVPVHSCTTNYFQPPFHPWSSSWLKRQTLPTASNRRKGGDWEQPTSIAVFKSVLSLQQSHTNSSHTNSSHTKHLSNEISLVSKLSNFSNCMAGKQGYRLHSVEVCTVTVLVYTQKSG